MKSTQLQLELTAWLRRPHLAAQPAMPLPRLSVYRDLLFNNVEGFLETAFPIMQSLLEEDDWRMFTQRFFAEHACASPYFRDISYEFLTWLQAHFDEFKTQWPWLLELVHFEWAELAADCAETAVPVYKQGDITREVPVLTPALWVLAYEWPVHLFSQKPLMLEKPPLPSYLILWRSLEDHVKFLEISPTMAQLIASLQHNSDLTGLQLLAGAATIDLQNAGLQALHELKEHGIILGVKP